MKIALFTNTYLPHVGGVARSVSVYAKMYRELGHETLVFAPEFEGDYQDDEEIVRLPAIKNFNKSGFSVRLPSPVMIGDALDDFQADVIHSHHPFLVGDAALRAAYARDLPLVFTHHTLYEQYTNYLPFHGEFAQRAAASLATAYANACDLVFAPSESLAKLIRERGVESPVAVQPTGVDLPYFAGGDGAKFKHEYKIDEANFVFGHVGRLALEKNLRFLCEAVCEFLEKRDDAVFVIVGGGDEEEELKKIVEREGANSRVVFTGSLQGEKLAGAYAAFDAFCFSSQSETQGLVLVEAMASGTPVVALDGPGVRDVLKDGVNGLMLEADASRDAYVAALERVIDDVELYPRLSDAAKETSHDFEHRKLAAKAIERYGQLKRWDDEEARVGPLEEFESLAASLEGEWELLKARATAAMAGLISEDESAVELK